MADIEEQGGRKASDAETPGHSTLVHRTCKLHEVKDLLEVQARRDLRKFAEDSEAAVALHVDTADPNAVVAALVEELVTRGKLTAEEANDALESSLTDGEDFRALAETYCSVRSNAVSNSSWAHSHPSGQEQEAFVVIMAAVHGLKDRVVAMARLPHEANLGPSHPFVRMAVLVAGPPAEEVAATKSTQETGQTFASLLTHPELTQRLRAARDEEEFKRAILEFLESDTVEALAKKKRARDSEEQLTFSRCRPPVGGIWKDLGRRLPWYLSDWKDGIWGFRASRKTFSTIFFLYFSCILPAIAFGIVNHHNTDGAIDVKKTIYAQAIGGLLFALFGGSPMIVLLSTAPLALYTKVVYAVSVQSGFPFFAVFGWTGIFTGLFLVAYALLEASVLMKYSTRFSEETFGFFISIAFSYDALLPMAEDFAEHFYGCGKDCHQELSLYFLILIVFTVYVGFWLFSIRDTPFFSPSVRDFVSDFSLPIAVGAGTVFGSLILYPVDAEPFIYVDQSAIFFAPLLSLPIWAIFIAMGLGFLLSLLFFIDQNISAAFVNAKENKLTKGHSYHLDLYVIGMVTILLSTLGLPWVHAALPHSPLHVRAMADTENVYFDGHVGRRVVVARETRVTALVSHLLILASTLMVPVPLQVIPVPVLYGVFLYLAVTALPGNQLWERLLLFITESRQYPPNSYVRRVPKRVLHSFTFFQVLCVLMLCVFGFTPVDYVQMFLPVAIIVLLPIRHFIVPRLFRKEHLDALDH